MTTLFHKQTCWCNRPNGIKSVKETKTLIFGLDIVKTGRRLLIDISAQLLANYLCSSFVIPNSKYGFGIIHVFSFFLHHFNNKLVTSSMLLTDSNSDNAAASGVIPNPTARQSNKSYLIRSERVEKQQRRRFFFRISLAS